MAMIFAFGPFRLDAEAETLFRGAEPLPIGKRAVALLRVLLEHPGAPVSKDALIERAWSGLAVEENNLTVQIAALRRVLGGEGGEGWIETLPRRGYRFLGPAVTPSEAKTPATAMLRPPDVIPEVPDKPSIAVLPFDNLSGDPQQEYFVDGMVEEITTALARIRWLFVIARNSSFTYKGRAVDVKEVGRELGVRYALEGSVRKAGQRVRIIAQLIDAANNTHLWAGRFDDSMEDIFELQDKVASTVAGVIEPTMLVAEYRRSTQRPTNDLAAYNLYLQAHAISHSWTREATMRALDLLGRALNRDAHYGLALAQAAFLLTSLDANCWSEDQQRNRQDALDLARRALQASGDNPDVLGNVANVLGYFEPDIDIAIALIDRALDLNPSHAIGWTRSGWLRLWAGQADVGIEHFERALRLNPLRRSSATFGIAVGHFFARRTEKAAEMLSLSLQENSEWPPTLRFMASCLAHLGRLEEAGEVVNQLRAITPIVIPRAEHWRIREDREYFLDGLRLAVGE